MFRLSYSLRLILVGLVVISSFTCDGMPAPLPKGISLPKSPAKTTPKVAPQQAPPPPPPPPPPQPKLTLSKSTAPPKTPSATPTALTAAPKKSPSKVTATPTTTSKTSHPTPTNSASKSNKAPTNSTATSSQPTGTSRTCPVKPPSKKPVKTRSLFRRSGPADASGDITLYHGTTPSSVAGLKAGINLVDGTAEFGDFSDNYGFYLTDRMKAAGQFVCHSLNKPTTESASIFEYKWAGSSVSSTEIYKFTGESTTWQDFVGSNNNPTSYNPRRPGSTKTSTDYRNDADDILEGKIMITGPMNLEEDKDLTDNFWQYTLIDEDSVGKLTLVTVHDNIPCSKFPSGTIGVTDSQGPSEDFPEAEKTELGIC